MKVHSIHVVYEDGEERYAVGEDADKVMQWLHSCEVMAHIHGSTYTGPTLQVIKEPSPQVAKFFADREKELEKGQQ